VPDEEEPTARSEKTMDRVSGGDAGRHQDVVDELVVTQDRLRALLDGVPAMIGHWNTELRSTMANSAYRE